MLTWVGKAPLRQVTAFPAQHIEAFDPTGSLARKPAAPNLWQNWPAAYPKGGLLFHGDNKDVLAHLLASGFRGKVDLIYIDPPFDSAADYVRKVALRGAAGSATLEGESYTLGEQIQYTDIWAHDSYLQFMYERLLLLRELLAEDGSLWVHCDSRKNHLLRCILDELFGERSFTNEVVWLRTTNTGSSKALAQRLSADTDTLFWYRKSEQFVFNRSYREYGENYRKRFRYEDDRGRYRWTALKTYSQRRYKELEAAGLVRRGPNAQFPEVKQYEDELKGVPLNTLWDDIFHVNPMALENTGYPTQKPLELPQRIITIASRPGDLILDCFVGSGTTAAAAQQLGRRWIACDINKGAIQTTSKRLQTIIAEQTAAAGQGKLLEEDDPAAPAQLGFTVWRVNDYDLQIQHNEAVNLACEHIGIERTRSDSFFDGTLGSRLVKIIPFGHPLSPVDLEEIKRELEARPDEDRNVVAICLGKEFAADKWLEDWNRLRRGKGAVNRIEAIELRTDSKYGKFFAHQPAKAKVKITRKRDKIAVEIEDFISPTILERLQQQAGLVRPTIDDWRAMVDCVMIDSAYNGEVFSIALSDVPEKKSDLVSGSYALPAPKGKTTVAVKIVDMLGEEVLITATV
jgi:DNA modification methylase